MSLIQRLGTPVSERGLVTDQFWDYFNSSAVDALPQGYQVFTGPGTFNQILLRPNGVAGALVTLYDGTSTSDPVVFAYAALSTGDSFTTFGGIRCSKGLFINVTAQQLKFVLATYRTGGA